MITSDIDGDSRDTSYPNMGADEFDTIAISNGESVTIDWSQGDIDITVDEGGTLTLDGSASAIEMDFGTLSVSGVLNVNDDVLMKASIFNVGSTGVVNVGDIGTEIRAENLTVEGKITADGQGYTNNSGPGTGEESDYGAGGGAYGGDGANGGPGSSGGSGGSADSYTTKYLYYYPHLDAGSGGGDGNGSTGGSGGGVILSLIHISEPTRPY